MMNFIIVFILYALIDISWVAFIRGIKEEDIKTAMFSGGLISLFCTISGWIIFVDQSIMAGAGCVLGSIFGIWLSFKGKN